MTQQGPLPQANEEHNAGSSLTRKQKAVFSPLFNRSNPGSELRSPFWERPARSALFVQFLSFELSGIRNADNSHHHVISPKLKTSLRAYFIPEGHKILNTFDRFFARFVSEPAPQRCSLKLHFILTSCRRVISAI